MVESSKADRIPLQRRQAPFADAFSKRLWKALSGRKLKWLAEETGISSSMLSDYGKGGKVPGADKAVLIADALSVDVSWLLTGRSGSISDQLAEPGNRLLRDLVSPQLAAEASSDDDLVEIDQIDLRYGMGATYADSPIEVERRQFSREWLRSFTHAAPSHLTWALGDGDSMEPTIRSGEVILIDRSQDTPRSGDGIWACAMGEIGLIKRLRHLPGGGVELHSDNPLVPPQSTADGELHVVGRVIAVVRKL